MYLFRWPASSHQTADSIGPRIGTDIILLRQRAFALERYSNMSGGPSMKAILTCIAFAAMAGTALAQAEPPDDPLSVKPIASQVQTTKTDMIRSKIERMGYTDVVDLARDSTGIWHARAKKGTETVDVTVDKGGRIKPGL
jgi:hypothetical protein